VKRMAQDDMSDAGIVQSISNNLGAFFRHLFPGVLIMGAAYLAHKSWFPRADSHAWQSWQSISIAAIIALAAGNIWFAINRYVLHQIVDYLLYWRGVKGPSKSKLGYLEDLGRYVADSQCSSEIPQRARQHVVFRASSVLLLYIVGEMGIVFSWWSESDSLLAQHKCWISGGSLIILIAAVWQQIIARHIDAHVVEFGRRRDPERCHFFLF
jgi:hypothetical protein